jgi:truncated hemoglobin YjbI
MKKRQKRLGISALLVRLLLEMLIYRVGTVKVTKLVLKQDKVDELVEEFYKRLLKEPSFVSMFNERHVDIGTLKERQKIFIARLVNDDIPEAAQEQSNQVKNRHSFHASPERAKLWLDTMNSTINDMDYDDKVKELLKNKIKKMMANIGCIIAVLKSV